MKTYSDNMISVLMAIRNGSKYFSESLASALAQQYKHWELIVCVNGLPPESDIYQKVRAGLEGVTSLSHRWYTLLDMPVCRHKLDALNYMMLHANGSHVAILDVDDIWHPNKLSSQSPYLNAYDVVGTMGEYIGTTNGKINLPEGEITFSMLMEANCLLNSSVVMKRACAKWEETDDIRFLDDYPLWLRLASEGRTLMNVGGEPLVKIRIHDEQWFAGREDVKPLRDRYKDWKPQAPAFAESDVGIGGVIAPSESQVTVALCVIATGKYHEYAQRMIDSARRFFLPDCHVTILLFTDGPPVPGTIHCQIEHRPWPGPTLYRYHTMLSEANQLGEADYVFYCDADTLFVDTVGNEVLGDLVAVHHQGFYGRPRCDLSYENRPESKACISDNEGQHYYAGGFQGGRGQVFMQAMYAMREAIDDDAQRGITARWHDESHWNHYLIYGRTPDVSLPPAYLSTEEKAVPDAKLLALLKPQGFAQCS